MKMDKKLSAFGGFAPNPPPWTLPLDHASIPRSPL